MTTPSDLIELEKKAQVCLDKKVDVPSAPLWHMQKVARKGTVTSLQTLQSALDYLTCKAKAKMSFTNNEKEFLKELYEAFWWGGHYKGYREAAQLANHYVNGEGQTLRIMSKVYEESRIVQATMSAMKKYIKERETKNLSIASISSSHANFLTKRYVVPLRNMNFRIEGKLKPNGVLEAAQGGEHLRLKKADSHFFLDSSTVRMPNGDMQTTWRVKSVYDFEPFEKHNYYSKIPLGKSELILYDGLSEYMTQIGVAKAFTHYSIWKEIWK